MSSPFAAGGVILDMAGAVFLAMGFIAKQPGAIVREAGTYVGSNPYLQISLLKQKADAQVGLGYLLFGFLGQFVGATSWSPRWACFALVLPIALSAVALGPLVLRFVRRRYAVPPAVSMVDRRLAKLAAETPAPNDETWVTATEFLGEILDARRRPGEKLADFGRRVAGGKHWNKLARHLPERLLT